MGHEPDRNDWLGKTLRHSSEAAPDACLDAETLAAWADGGLNAQGRDRGRSARVELSAVHGYSRGDGTRGTGGPSSPRSTPARLFRWLVPITAAATAVALWVIVPDRPATVPVAAPVEEFPGGPAPARMPIPAHDPLLPRRLQKWEAGGRTQHRLFRTQNRRQKWNASFATNFVSAA